MTNLQKSNAAEDSLLYANELPIRLTGDKAYDSDKADSRLKET